MIRIDIAIFIDGPGAAGHLRMAFVGPERGIALAEEIAGLALVRDRDGEQRGIVDREGSAMAAAAKLEELAVPVLWQRCEES